MQLHNPHATLLELQECKARLLEQIQLVKGLKRVKLERWLILVQNRIIELSQLDMDVSNRFSFP